MGVEKNGRYLKKMVFMSILVLIIDVIVRAFVLFLFFLNLRQTGVVAYRCAIYIYTKIYRIYVQTRYDNT